MITVDWANKIIDVPQADLTLVSGTLYELDTEWFKDELTQLEASLYGMPNIRILDHNTSYTVAGVTYARKVEIINGYQVRFEAGTYSVRLVGSNNNIFDVENGVLFQNSVSVISNNAAGLIVHEVGSGVTEQDKLDIADRVWDETLTGSNHNDPTSAGRRLRDISTSVIITGTSPGGNTINTCVLDNDASAVQGAYDPALISIVGGTGMGQTRLILEYHGSTKTAVVDRGWKVTPDATSEYTIVAHPGREHINEGLAQGGTTNTITLNALASSDDDAYIGQVVLIRSGTGEDQALRVQAYNGTTKVATMGDDWAVVPDTTSAYVMLPTSIIIGKHIANAVWNEPVATHLNAGTTGERLDVIPTDTENADAVWNKELP